MFLRCGAQKRSCGQATGRLVARCQEASWKTRDPGWYADASHEPCVVRAVPTSAPLLTGRTRALFRQLNSDVNFVSSFTSHGRKVTVLSWMAKAAAPMGDRRLLGGRAVHGERSPLGYSRDALTGPLLKLEECCSPSQSRLQLGQWMQRCSTSALSGGCARSTGRRPPQGAALPRLWFQTHVTDDGAVRQRMERTKDDEPRKISQPERGSRKERLEASLNPGHRHRSRARFCRLHLQPLGPHQRERIVFGPFGKPAPLLAKKSKRSSPRINRLFSQQTSGTSSTLTVPWCAEAWRQSLRG